MARNTQLVQNSNFRLEKIFENLARFFEPIAMYLIGTRSGPFGGLDNEVSIRRAG
jgi:hypothetical protein